MNTLNDVRYLADGQTDSNVSRQILHPLWRAAQKAAAGNLTNFRSGLTPGQLREVERTLAMERYAALCLGNALGLAVASGLPDQRIVERLPELVKERLLADLKARPHHIQKAIERTRARLYFIDSLQHP